MCSDLSQGSPVSFISLRQNTLRLATEMNGEVNHDEVPILIGTKPGWLWRNSVYPICLPWGASF